MTDRIKHCGDKLIVTVDGRESWATIGDLECAAVIRTALVNTIRSLLPLTEVEQSVLHASPALLGALYDKRIIRSGPWTIGIIGNGTRHFYIGEIQDPSDDARDRFCKALAALKPVVTKKELDVLRSFNSCVLDELARMEEERQKTLGEIAGMLPVNVELKADKNCVHPPEPRRRSFIDRDESGLAKTLSWADTRDHWLQASAPAVRECGIPSAEELRKTIPAISELDRSKWFSLPSDMKTFEVFRRTHSGPNGVNFATAKLCFADTPSVGMLCEEVQIDYDQPGNGHVDVRILRVVCPQSVRDQFMKRLTTGAVSDMTLTPGDLGKRRLRFGLPQVVSVGMTVAAGGMVQMYGVPATAPALHLRGVCLLEGVVNCHPGKSTNYVRNSAEAKKIADEAVARLNLAEAYQYALRIALAKFIGAGSQVSNELLDQIHDVAVCTLIDITHPPVVYDFDKWNESVIPTEHLRLQMDNLSGDFKVVNAWSDWGASPMSKAWNAFDQKGFFDSAMGAVGSVGEPGDRGEDDAVAEANRDVERIREEMKRRGMDTTESDERQAKFDSILKSPCPLDTNGDGNCGAPACPICAWRRGTKAGAIEATSLKEVKPFTLKSTEFVEDSLDMRTAIAMGVDIGDLRGFEANKDDDDPQPLFIESK